jgi:hypothetical protein
MVADVASVAIGQLVADVPLVGGLPIEIILAAAVLNAAVAAIVLVPARLVVARYAPDEAPAW